MPSETKDQNGNTRAIRSLGEDWQYFTDHWDGFEAVGNGVITSVKCVSKGEEWLVIVTARDGDTEFVWFRGIEGLQDLPHALVRCLTSDRWKVSRPYEPKN